MRLIDADALERAVMFLGEDSICNDCAYEFVNLMDEQPTIEAEPVRRGKWIQMPMACYGGGTITEYKCSECSEHQMIESKWCPNCGAKMAQGDERCG